MDIAAVVDNQRAYFRAGKTRELAGRLERLQALREAVKSRESVLMDALRLDLNKSPFESFSTEIGLVLAELTFAIKQLPRWVKPVKVRRTRALSGSKSWIVAEPLGTALILAPWNYPVQLSLIPLIGALAAGNTAVLKPSELAPNASRALAALIADTFDPCVATVIEGGPEVGEALLRQPFDHIFFTGGAAVGKRVMAAAAEQLTPVTLELGGKSPCIVHRDAKLPLAAKRIAHGKWMNSGQTCLAPDYLFVHEEVRGPFLSCLEASIRELYGKSPLANPDYGRIVNDTHFARLQALLQDGRAVVGGGVDEDRLVMEPTVLEGARFESPLMQQEIFGPILPVFSYESMEEAYRLIESRPKPLALYVFTENPAIAQETIDRLSFGGGCVNDVSLQAATPYLPFGGVGGSGFGRYHGEFGFRTFSHEKGILKQTTRFDFRFRYPNGKLHLPMLRRFLK